MKRNNFPFEIKINSMGGNKNPSRRISSGTNPPGRITPPRDFNDRNRYEYRNSYRPSPVIIHPSASSMENKSTSSYFDQSNPIEFAKSPNPSDWNAPTNKQGTASSNKDILLASNKQGTSSSNRDVVSPRIKKDFEDRLERAGNVKDLVEIVEHITEKHDEPPRMPPPPAISSNNGLLYGIAGATAGIASGAISFLRSVFVHA